MKNKNYILFSFIVGFTVWLLATIAFRVAGQYFFITDNTVVLLTLYLMLIPVLGFLAISVFKRFDLNHLESIKSAAVMVLPGMILDTVCVQFFAEVFPNMPESDGNTFGSWLMFAYSIILLSALFRTSKRQNT
ncbi:DUF5367 family protein [Sphingobacterium corticibacter]|uniref:DUF5367 domain-containing protein n=1 Tax=Sphingobacterium corticibacter TaxID=2171749 RepID=A0A2T8HF73_9SPHI|nr:DUF5367 family protein [Sphingobacterium corticibacter]PVH24087.1 hypothetical protein DC487_15215 [Sphingobacterium corticibacter]